MKSKANLIGFMVKFVVIVVLYLNVPSFADAHCDTMDGPVVKAAQKALESKNIHLVLIWVAKADEAEIKQAFEKTLAVRTLSPEAKELADRYFFETLIRIHRAGEGEPYTGLKPAGSDLGPVIPAADKALETRSPEALTKVLIDALHAGLNERFKQALAKMNFKKEDVDSGREFVKAYVEFMHYVEGIYDATKKAANGHHLETETSKTHVSEPHTQEK